MQELNQVSIWEVVEPTKIINIEQPEIFNLKYSWYRGGFFKINSISCNMYSIEINNNIRKYTIVIDRNGKMDQITFENEIPKPKIFWRNINKIIFNSIKLSNSINTFDENRFCIRVNNKKILAGPDVSKKRDKNLTKFLKLIDVEGVENKIKELIIKYEEIE